MSPAPKGGQISFLTFVNYHAEGVESAPSSEDAVTGFLDRAMRKTGLMGVGDIRKAFPPGKP
eukprot:2317059-Pleurochrysis_carterae.AAC.1